MERRADPSAAETVAVDRSVSHISSSSDVDDIAIFAFWRSLGAHELFSAAGNQS